MVRSSTATRSQRQKRSCDARVPKTGFWASRRSEQHDTERRIRTWTTEEEEETDQETRRDVCMCDREEENSGRYDGPREQ